MRRLLLSLVLTGVSLALPGAAAAAPSEGALAAGGCYSGSAAGCAVGRALDGAQSVAVSADGRHVYAASKAGDGVAIFLRDPGSGLVLQPQGAGGCIGRAITGCQPGAGLNGPDAIALSPDGLNAYVASEDGDTLAILKRDPDTGALQSLTPPLNCIGNTISSCGIRGRGLNQPEAVVVSPNGENVYIPDLVGDAVAAFSRDPAQDGNPGNLTQLSGKAGCRGRGGGAGPSSGLNVCHPGFGLNGAEALAISPDGRHLYASSLYDDSVAEFAVSPADGSLSHTPATCAAEVNTAHLAVCSDARGIDHPEDVTVSRDGKHVYVAGFGSDSVAVLSRDAASGNLSQAQDASACVSETGSGGLCADGTGLDGAESVTVSPDGKHVYVGAVFSNAIATFRRDPASGALTQLPGADACISNGGAFGCAPAGAISGLNAVAVAPGGEYAYATAENSDSLTIFGRFPRTTPVADTKAPRVSRLRLRPRVFVPAGGPSVARHLKRGTRVAYSLSELANVRFTVRRAMRGRRAKGKCRRPTRANRGRRRCTRLVRLKGSFAHSGTAGRNSFRFTGRLRGVKLRPGRYRLIGIAKDGAANRSKPMRKRFRIARVRHR